MVWSSLMHMTLVTPAVRFGVSTQTAWAGQLKDGTKLELCITLHVSIYRPIGKRRPGQKAAAVSCQILVTPNPGL